MRAVGAMLANGAGSIPRRELDFYPTPAEVTHALMLFLERNGHLNGVSVVWEPACGDGAMSKIIEGYVPTVLSSDIRKNAYGHSETDFLGTDFNCDAIITNPPFNLSEDFLKHALSKPRTVAMLLKSQYWHAKKRLTLFNKHPPAYVLPLTWRPDFINTKGGSPTMEVIWTVWTPEQTDVAKYVPLAKPSENEMFWGLI